MSDGDEAAIVNGLRNDAQNSIPGAAKALAEFGDDTSAGMSKGLEGHAATEASNTRMLENAGKRPAEAPLENPKVKVPATTAAKSSSVLSDDDVTDAGIGSGGVASAESGATDPVDLVSGQLLESVIDFSLPGVLPLVLRRAYASGYAHGGLFGPGWASTLDTRLLVDEDGAVRFLGDDAQCLDFGIPAGVGLGLPSYPAYGSRWALTRDSSDGAWTVADPFTGVSFRFPAAGPVRLLEAIRDQAGNEIRIRRAGDGSPLLIEHSGGYQIRVACAQTPAGTRLAGYALEVGDGTVSTMAAFEHDEAGRLVRVLDSNGAAHSYEYDAHDRVCAWIDRSGYRYPYRYDQDGRVVEAGQAGEFKHALIGYDQGARVTAVTDGLGHTIRYHYNRLQQVIKVTDPLGAETRARRDVLGRLLEHTTPLGHTTAYEYDTDGNRTKIAFPDGNAIQMTYQGPGRLMRVDLPDGASWHYAYDERGNIISETDPLGAATAFAYDEHGAVIAVTDPLGGVQRYETDAAGLPIAATNPRGGRTVITRDRFGQITAVQGADGLVRRIERDGEGRVLAETDALGLATRYSYDAAGNQTAVIDPSGRATRIEFGPFATPVARTNPDGTRFSFAYDPELRLTTVTGPTGLVWSYRYNENGQRIAERDFDGREGTYGFDEDGQVSSYTAPDGQVSTYERDAEGRLIELRTGPEAARFGYDRVGRLTSAINRHATVAITRDLLGRTVREEINGQAVTTSYDPAGNLLTRTTPSGARSAWTYDEAGNPASLSAGTATITFERDVLGRETRREIGELRLDQTYDASGLLTGQLMSARGRTLQERTYGYDADGIPTRIADLLRGTRELQLDQAGRITGVHHGDTAERYRYDAIGNLTVAETPHLPAGADSEPAAVSGDRAVAGTRVTRAGRTTYIYDLRGRLTGKTRRTLSGQKLSWTYTWNAHDRLTAVTRPDGTQWSYRYDALGRRLDKTQLSADGQADATIRFVWDGTVLVEQTAERHETRPVTITWDYEPDGYCPAAQRRASAQFPGGGEDADSGGEPDQGEIDAEFWAIVTDLNGTPQELISREGEIDWTARTLLWGGPLGAGNGPEAGQVDCPIGFPGQYHDPETGLYYNNQRYYDPDTATYLSPDPLGLDAAPNPQRYVSNPLTLADPLGLTPKGPITPRKSDAQLVQDAESLQKTMRRKTDPTVSDRTENGTTVSVFQAEDDGSLFYTANRNKTSPKMVDLAKDLGYRRIAGKKFTEENQTDAEQIMLNAVDKGAVPKTGRLATSRPPCKEMRPNGKDPAQNCEKRIGSYKGITHVGKFRKK